MNALRERRAGRILLAVLPWVVAAVLLVAFAYTADPYLLLIAGTVIIYAISAIGLNLLMGQAGLVSIGNAALMAVGAFTTAILSPVGGWGTFPVPLLVSGVTGGVVGLLVALPAMRLRGVYLALATLALQFFVAFAGDRYQQHTKAVSGVAVNPITIGDYSFSYGPQLVLLLAVLLGLTIIVVRALLRHAPGRIWNAIRESELAAGAVGVNSPRWKLAAFVVSSVIISMAGSLLAYYTMLVSTDTFSLDFAITFIVMLIVGGTGTIAGAVVGAVIVAGLPYALTALTQNLPQEGIGTWLSSNVFYINNGLYGILVLVVLLYLPEGIVPALTRLARGVRHRDRHAEAARPVAAVTVPDPRPPGALAPLLDVRGLSVTYRAGARAIDGVSLRVEDGSVVALLGRNGAGKTSTLRALSGFFTSERVKVTGEALLAGRPMLDRSPTATAEAGVVLVPERNKVFPSLTVAEHFRIATSRGHSEIIQRDSFRRLRERLDQPAGLLSGGERQLLALAVAASLRPRLLMVDEFSLGLAPAMIQQVSEIIQELRSDLGISVLLVEQNAGAALSLADRIYLLEGGAVVAEGTPDEIADHRLLLTSAEPT